MNQATALPDTHLHERLSSHPEVALAVLQWVMPPTSVVVVGVNRLNPLWLTWPRVRGDRILLVDAQHERLQAIQQHLPYTRDWKTCDAVLDAEDGSANFHTLNHANESGLLAADSLRGLWPNIRSLHTTERLTRRLDTLLASDAALLEPGDKTSGWLVINCLPAARVLQGAAGHLQQCSVVALRALVGGAADSGIEGASLKDVYTVLGDAGFRLSFSLEETHPHIITAVFVRNAESGKLSDAIAARDAEALAKVEAVFARDALQKQVTELQTRVAALTEERADLTFAWEMDVQAKEEAVAARDAERAATAEAMKAREQTLVQLQRKEAELAALAKENAELVAGQNEAQERLKEALERLDTVAAEQTDATQKHDAMLGELTLERDEARKQLADQAERMQQLEAENAEAQQRHQLMQDEMVKAEAQIELIKDLLLREQGA